jgi:hypothetical protein
MEQWDRIEINMASNQCQSVLKCTLLMELLKYSFTSTISVSMMNRTILNLEMEGSSETEGFNETAQLENNFCYFIVCLTHAF